MTTLDKIINSLRKESENMFLWTPVLLSVGILLFFNLNFIPNLTYSVLVFALTCYGIFYFHKSYKLFISAIAISLIALGYLAANYRTINIDAPILKEKTENIWVRGHIAEIQHNGNAKRLILENVRIKGVHKLDTPKRMRLNVRTKLNDAEIGDKVLMRGVLMPPPEPAIPKGFDFAEFAYFKQIGAIGYATSHVRILEKQTDINTYARRLAILRKTITKIISEDVEQPASGVASALLVGDTSAISQDDYDAMRIAGIAHLLAISGMHMAIVVAILFLATRYLLSRSSYLALKFNLKKISAVLALVGSFCYLLISGSPVSAERAFLMSALVLLAIILDRSATPMRSIAIAVIVILLGTPEAVMSASFQMSFAACIALIAAFEKAKMWFIVGKDHQNWFKKGALYFAAIMFSTLIAGMATAPFVVYHFNQFSTYSLLANLISIPLNDFLIMPSGVLALVLMPAGLEQIGLIPMEWGINIMLGYAKHISSLPNASFYVPSFTKIGLVLITIGGLIICFLSTKLRLIGILPLMLGLLTIYDYRKPDIMLDKEGKVFAIQTKEGSLAISSKRAGRFIRKVWSQNSGQEDMQTLQKIKAQDCSEHLCHLNRNKQFVTIVAKDEDPSDACDKVDLFINLTKDSFICKLATKNINLVDLKFKGAHSIWLDENKIKIETVAENRKFKIWRQNGL